MQRQNLKLVIVWEYHNTKIFLRKVALQIGLNNFCGQKSTVPWTYAISDLNGEIVLGRFYEKAFQKTSQTEFRIPKVTKKATSLSNGRAVTIYSIAQLIWKT